MISDEILKEFASGILISDIHTYINNHKKEYADWLNKNKISIERSSKDELCSAKSK